MTRFVMIALAGCLLSGLALSPAVHAQPAPRQAGAAPAPPAANQQETLSPEERQRREDWQKAIARTPMPKTGCFTTAYPSTTWQETPCGPPPKRPYQPAQGPRPFTIGNGNDVSAGVSGAPISSATGRFDSVSAGTTITSQFSLQLNPPQFPSTSCGTVAGCLGWQQFIYSSQNACTGGVPCIFIEYWLLGFGTCPSAAWTQSGSSCYINTGFANAPAITGAQLQGTALTGTASGGVDTVVLTTPGGGAAGMATNSVLGLQNQWPAAEFNIFGDGGGSQVTLGGGATIAARTEVTNGSTAPPTCLAKGYTGETNNLSFGPGAPPTSPPGPAVLFEESLAGGAPSACAAATTVGDTHLGTYNGLAYDFQASGDFVLSETEPDFVVQNRQVSGAPTWPNAAVNHGVATRMGRTSVAVCIAPDGDDRAPGRLFIDGHAVSLGSGQSVAALGGVQVWRIGNLFTVTSASGDSIQAQVNAIPGGTRWINVTVGLGRWPATVRGLLANANGDVNQIAARTGTVLTRPFALSQLYGVYGDSWRVPAAESLLSVCGDRTENANPTATFYAGDLDATLREHGRAVCTAAGVKPGPLLDNCILDVTVIGGDAAAPVFAGARAPVAVGLIAPEGGGGGGGGGAAWQWVLTLLVLALLVWVLRTL